MDKFFTAAGALNTAGCYCSAIGYCHECKLPPQLQRSHVKNTFSMLGVANASLAVTCSALGAIWKDLERGW
jgi:hypothetical protein